MFVLRYSSVSQQTRVYKCCEDVIHKKSLVLLNQIFTGISATSSHSIRNNMPHNGYFTLLSTSISMLIWGLHWRLLGHLHVTFKLSAYSKVRLRTSFWNLVPELHVKALLNTVCPKDYALWNCRVQRTNNKMNSLKYFHYIFSTTRFAWHSVCFQATRKWIDFPCSKSTRILSKSTWIVVHHDSHFEGFQNDQ